MEAVNKEAIRMLVAEIGYTRTAEKTGIKRDTLYKWGQRKGWNTPIHDIRSKAVQLVQSPSAILQDELADAERETKLSLARSAKRLAKDAEQCTLRDSPYVHQVAKTASIVHRWDSQQRIGLQLNVLNVDGSMAEVKPAKVKSVKAAAS